jgi:predicted flap endonuclease-1-like 5' DNA nuclease
MPIPVDEIKQALNDLGLQAPRVSTTRLPGNLVTITVTARCDPNAEPPLRESSRVVTVRVTPVADKEPDTMVPQPAQGKVVIETDSAGVPIKPAPGRVEADDLTVIPSIGPATAAKLADFGITTFNDLRALTEKELHHLLNPYAIRVVRAWLSSNP